MEIYKKLCLDATLDFIKMSDSCKSRCSRLSLIVDELKRYSYFNDARYNFLDKNFSISKRMDEVFPTAYGVYLKNKSDGTADYLIGANAKRSDFSGSDAFVMFHSVLAYEQDIYLLSKFFKDVKRVKSLENARLLSEHLIFSEKNKICVGSSSENYSNPEQRIGVLRTSKALLIPSSW